MSKKTFEAAAAANAHLIVQLKDNQPSLCQKVEAVCVAAVPLSSVQTVDAKRRNRHETRAIAVFDATPAVTGTEWEPHVAAVIQVERAVNAFQPATGLWKASLETSFYLSNRAVDAKSRRTPFASTGESRTNPTTRVMSRYAKMRRVSEKIPASSRECGASLTISCAAINPTPSPKTATPLLSEASNQYFQ